MPKFEKFGDFIRERFKTQANAAKALKTSQNVISNWVTGRNNPELDMQKVLFEKWGYDGDWKPKAESPPGGVTREEYIDLKAALKAHIEYWQAGERRVLERLAELDQRVGRIEKRASD